MKRAMIGLSVMVLAMAGCGVKEPDTITIDGVVTVVGDLVVVGDDGACPVNTGGYSDIRNGAQVKVSDGGGTVVTVGSLGEGKPTSPLGYDETVEAGGYTNRCEFPFSIAGVPADLPVYGIEVSQRGAVMFNKDQVGSPVALQLGGS